MWIHHFVKSNCHKCRIQLTDLWDIGSTASYLNIITSWVVYSNLLIRLTWPLREQHLWGKVKHKCGIPRATLVMYNRYTMWWLSLLQRGPSSPRLPQLQCAVYWPGLGVGPNVSVPQKAKNLQVSLQTTAYSQAATARPGLPTADTTASTEHGVRPIYHLFLCIPHYTFDIL